MWGLDHRWLMARGKGEPARLWDLSAPGKGARVAELGEDARPSPFLVSADSHWMVALVFPKSPAGTSSMSSVVRLWELTPDGPPSRPIAVKDEQEAVTFVGRSDKLLTRHGSQFSLWDLKSGLKPSGPTVLAGQNPKDPAYRFQFTPYGRRLALIRSKGGVPIWDLEHPTVPPNILSHSETLITNVFTSLFFTPDGRRAILHLNDGRVFLWELDGPRPALDPVELPDPEKPEERKGETDSRGPTETLVRRPKAPLYFYSSNRDGRWLIDAGRGGKVRLWDLMASDPFKSPARTFPGRESLPLLPSSSSPFTADGRWLATAEGNQLHLWNLQGEEPTDQAKIPLQSLDHIRTLTVDPTGRWVALAGSDNQLHLWELTPDRPFERTILQPAPGGNPWNQLFLSPGGKRVTAFGYDPVARVYRVPLDELREAARRAVGRNLTRDEWNRYFPGQDYHKTFESLPEPSP